MFFSMKTIIILACSKTKAWSKEPELRGKPLLAGEAYRGAVFLYGKKYAEKHSIPYLILSARYGLINPETMIEDYEQKLKSKKESSEIRIKFYDELKDLFARYDKIFLIGGDQYYRNVLQGFDDTKLKYIKSKNQADLRSKIKAMAAQ
jgi:hypothetical protein